MSDHKIRGHLILHTARYLQEHADPVLRRYLDVEASAELRTTLQRIDAAAFYARTLQTEMLGALARGGGAQGHAALMQCGASLLQVRNEFATLLMKVLTPELLIRKLPRLWLRDHIGGTCEVQSLDGCAGRGSVRMRGVGGYRHIGIFWLGFVQGALRELAGSQAQVQQQGWSWDDPAPSEINYEVRWS